MSVVSTFFLFCMIYAISRTREDNSKQMSHIYKAAQTNDENFFRLYGDADTYMCYKHEKSGDSVLHIASRYGHLNLVHLLLEKGGNPEIVNLDGKRPLHDAAQTGQIDIVKYLLDYGATVDCLKRADWTPLMLACTKTKPEVIQALLEKGADPALRNKDGWNSFHIAAREGSVEILQLLLHHDAHLWNTVSKNGRTPLHTAALNGCTDIVQFLVESCDYPCDMVDSCGTTPLMDALRAGYVDTAQVLLNLHKADVEKEDKLGRQPVHLVAEAGQLEALDFLLDTFHMSVDTMTSTTHCTPLHVAAKEGQDMIIECLLRRGANVHLLDTSLRSALHIASGGQHAGCVELLLQHGAGDSQDKHGQTARQMAKKDDVKQVFKKYLDHIT